MSFLAISLITGCSREKKNPKAPAIGSSFTVDGLPCKVVGKSKRKFAYKADGKGLILIHWQAPEVLKTIMVPDKGVTVEVDPDKGSCKIDGGNLLDKRWLPGEYVLLEYPASSESKTKAETIL
jgi:hypothetical protein